MNHESVLLEESLSGLLIKPDGVYVDGTFGRGGHSKAILARLSSKGRLFAIDKDLEAVAYANQHFSKDMRFKLFHGSFARIADFAEEAGVYGQIDGILLDLGVSSPQFDDETRGFSFMKEGPLDMRMNTEQALSAAEFVNTADVDDMIHVFREYGEERFARRIANAIVEERVKAPIVSTQVLAEIVKKANPRWEKHKHPATRVFQAVRIHINNELDELKSFLEQSVDVLAVGGRLVIISFHSLEDRLVKRFMQVKEQGVPLPRGLPIRSMSEERCFKRVGKAIKASDVEVQHNIRSRSAILRVGEKLA
ncbi:MAG: 16S rRNA (cytosine(1402)-N(4))-methyltransferase [Legionellales bacterium RIFCSPHIGHO2_12_FULL_42_9]|nr:MAG: 16S rRNA (cytosine(1402)-N(4))-methyltransferase [Legionellales bacterium RIFCSPHIGHO2_12_FULL_42_9]